MTDSPVAARPPVRTQRGRATVLMVGHFPPPVHGMAVAFEALAAALEVRANVVRLPTSPHRLDGTAGYHVVRVVRVLRTLIALVRRRRSGRTMIMSVDAGPGMVYGIVLVLTARALRYRLYLQHHSYAYLNRPSVLMRVLVRCAGPGTHLCSCPEMAAAMRRTYPRAVRVATVPVSYAIEEPAAAPDGPSPHPGPPALRIGHFGNLSMDKGLRVAVEAFEAVQRTGVPAVLILAGPASSPAEAEFICDVTSRHPQRVHYAGPVYDQDKVDLLRTLDVLLFPSTYSHESFGLSLWECLCLGVPAIAFRAGCLTQSATGDGAVVLEPGEVFAESALPILRELHVDPARLAARRTAARHAAAAWIHAGREAVDRLVGEVCRT